MTQTKEKESEKQKEVKGNETEEMTADLIEESSGCNVSVVLFVTLLSLARVAHGFFW